MTSSVTRDHQAGNADGAPEPAATKSERRAPRSLIAQAIYDTFGQTGARIGGFWLAFIAVLAVFAPFLASSHPLLMRERGGPLTSPLLASLGALDVCLLIYFVYALWVLLRRTLAAPTKLAFLLWPLMALIAVLVTFHLAMPLATLTFYRPEWLAKTSGGGAAAGWIWVIAVNVLLAAVLVGLLVLAVRATVAFARTAALTSPVMAAGALMASALMLLSSYTVQPPVNVVYETYRDLERAGRVETAVRTLIPYSPNDRLRHQPDAYLLPPNREHWLGTTLYRENLLSRMIHACRVALAIGVIATGVATLIGVTFGGVMGYAGGAVDLLGMRLLEIVEAIPTLILLLIVTVFFGRNLYLMMVVIGLVTWTADARFIRAEFLKLRNLEFVHAGIAAGLPRSSIIFRHMLPNGIAPVLVNASFGIAGAILLESTLSFLGLGLGPDDPSWGQLLNQARSGGRGFSWWIATFPGAAIFLTVFAYILIGESMRDAIDPKLKKAA